MPTMAAKTKPQRQRWTMKQLCATYYISHEAVLAHIRRKDDPMPSMRFGRRWVFDPDAIEKWMARQARRATKG